MRVVVLADTHVRAGGPRGAGGALPAPVHADLARAEVILHAGDVVHADLLAELEGYAPVLAVLGNNDRELRGRLPEVVEVELGGVPIAMVHDSGPRAGRATRMARRFPDARVVVFGHSHLPEDRLGVGRQRLFNPGSPTQRRRAPSRSYGVLNVGGGRVAGHRIVELPEA